MLAVCLAVCGGKEKSALLCSVLLCSGVVAVPSARDPLKLHRDESFIALQRKGLIGFDGREMTRDLLPLLPFKLAAGGRGREREREREG